MEHLEPQNIFCAPKAKQNQGCVLLSWHSLAWTQPITLPSRFSWNMTWLDYQQKLVNESCKVTFHQFGDSGYIWLQICCFYAVLLLTSEFPYSLDKKLRPTSGAQFLEVRPGDLLGTKQHNCWIVSGGNFHLFLLGFDIPLKLFEPPPPCFTHGGCCLNRFSHLSPTCAKETNAQGQSGNSFWREEKGLFQIWRPLKWMGFWFTTLLNLDTNLGILLPILDSGFTKLKSCSTGFSSNLGITRILPSRRTAHQSVAKIVVGSDGIGLRAATKCLKHASKTQFRQI